MARCGSFHLPPKLPCLTHHVSHPNLALPAYQEHKPPPRPAPSSPTSSLHARTPCSTRPTLAQKQTPCEKNPNPATLSVPGVPRAATCTRQRPLPLEVHFATYPSHPPSLSPLPHNPRQCAIPNHPNVSFNPSTSSPCRNPGHVQQHSCSSALLCLVGPPHCRRHRYSSIISLRNSCCSSS